MDVVSTTFDVPGTVTLKDVSAPKPGETAAERLHRLAQKAVIEGIQILREAHSGRLYASSSRGSGTLYALDMTRGRCTCDGSRPGRPCKHLALALAELGELPMPAPAPAVCPECRGERGFKRQCGGRLSDWVWETCRRCHGSGTVTAA